MGAYTLDWWSKLEGKGLRHALDSACRGNYFHSWRANFVLQQKTVQFTAHLHTSYGPI